MKFLVDANLSPRIATRLTDVGYDASHVVDHGLLAASDGEIAAFLRQRRLRDRVG